MSGAVDLARGWFRKGDSDLNTARLLAASEGPYDTACFHAPHAAEKYLKGFLSFVGQPFPFTHNLEELEQLCTLVNPSPSFTELDLTQLTPYAVQLRYDSDFWPDQETAQEALNIAEQVRNAISTIVPPDVFV